MRRLVVILALLGCFSYSGCQLPSRAHFEYDKKAYSVAGEALRRYIENDPSLSAEQKKERLAALDEWKSVIEDNLKE